MRPFSASQLLSLWEYGLAQPPWQRAISLLGAAFPDSTPDALTNLTLGQRDSQLLTLRESIFGAQLKSLASCPSCDERLELTFDVADIQVGSLPDPSIEQTHDPDGALSFALDGYSVTFRLPNSLDLAEIARISTPKEARQILLKRCLLSADENGEERTVADLPNHITSAIAEGMASSDPLGDVQITLTCPACAHQWQAAFDILSFFWIEINAWAQRILREVHLMASTYCWSEADILALSPWRRQAYLQMVTG
jgi:hypothetical protein